MNCFKNRLNCFKKSNRDNGEYTGEMSGIYPFRKKNGKGIFKYSNGNVYEGEFKDDIFHGYGTYTYSDGRTYTGLWEYDKAVITITEPEGYNDSLESYEIILFLSAHGCDVKDNLLNRYLPEEFKEHIDLKAPKKKNSKKKNSKKK